MKQLTLATVLSIGLATLATALAIPALADDGTAALPPGGAVTIYPQDRGPGGANPYTPFGTNPYVPYGVWSAH
jgi:hypothetical protein